MVPFSIAKLSNSKFSSSLSISEIEFFFTIACMLAVLIHGVDAFSYALCVF